MNDSPTVLVVDDEVRAVSSLYRALRKEQYNMISATTGKKALEVLDSHDISLVVCDYMMPEMNGLEVLAAAKKMKPLTSVVMLTAFGNMSVAIEALRQGADDFLLKPCKPKELRICLHRCLEKAAANKQLILNEKLVPVCCVCGLIRDDANAEKGCGCWMKVDEYLYKRSDATPSHTLCPHCFKAQCKKYGHDV